MRTPRRWEHDPCGQGIADGRWIAPRVARLQALLQLPHWVAEEPAMHLLPHLQQACDRADSPWHLVQVADLEAVYVVALEWVRAGGRARELRADVFSLIGQIAESVTFVEQQVAGDEVVFDLVTGMPDQGAFVGHGHLLQLRIGGGQVQRVIAGMGAGPG
jgi:hypothetical protein